MGPLALLLGPVVHSVSWQEHMAEAAWFPQGSRETEKVVSSRSPLRGHTISDLDSPY